MQRMWILALVFIALPSAACAQTPSYNFDELNKGFSARLEDGHALKPEPPDLNARLRGELDAPSSNRVEPKQDAHAPLHTPPNSFTIFRCTFPLTDRCKR